MKALIFCEQRSGHYKKNILEAVAAAKSLGAEIAGVSVGSADPQALKEFGFNKVYVTKLSQEYNVLAVVDAVDQAIADYKADVLLCVASVIGKDFSPRIAMRHECAIMTDVTSIKVNGADLEAQKPMYAGKVIATLKADGDGLKIVAIRPNVFEPAVVDAAAQIEIKELATGEHANLKMVDFKKAAATKIDLTEASRIISGGRALGSADAFKILYECSEQMPDSAVGASRAAVDAGYVGHDMQVGQTGKTVNPNLYIACGLSGSIQHMAGMRTSKVIVAINTDPDAPIFKIADYGIVADLFEAVPILTQKLKALA